jgi:hypothetical protein
MKKSIFIRALAALVACALVLPVVGSSKNPVERPLKVAGIFTSVPDETGFAGTFMVLGNATHLGKIVFAGDFTTVNMTPSGLVTVHIQGTYTAANGDTIVVECPNWVTQYDAVGNALTSTGLVNIIGGTGRFANASGSYMGHIYPGSTLIFAAEGVITY